MRLKLWRISIAAGFLSLIPLACSSTEMSQVSEPDMEEIVEETDVQAYADINCTAGVSTYLVEVMRENMEATSQSSIREDGYVPDVVSGNGFEAEVTEDPWEDQLMEYFGYLPSDEDMDLFYRTVQAECGYQEPDDGVGAVADVIANRCRSDTFPDTFSTWANGMIEAAEPSEQVLDVCRSRIEEGVVYSDILFFTAGYYNPYCEPAFVIGHHYFGTEKKV